jgi:endonuclease/exonuclease/phosphatase family metal-dependent hydrolase
MVNFLRKLNLWVVFFTLLAYAAPFISPAKVSLFLFFGLAFPWLLLANVVFILLWATSRMRFWWFSTVTLLVGWTHLTAVFGVNFWHNTEGPLKSENSLRVLTYNVADFCTPYHKDKMAGKQGMNAFFQKENADIICIQEGGAPSEFTNDQLFTLFPALATYPYVSRIKGNEVFVLSRFPIFNEGKSPEDKVGNGCTFSDIQMVNKKIRVFTFHLTSNKVSGMADQLVESGTVTDDDSWLSVGRMLKRVRRTGIIRTRESEYIAATIQQSPYPVIVCGDFNEIPVSYAYKTISKGLTDAFQEAAFGFSSTYNGNIPALKIDNILTSPTINARNCTIHSSIRYSDHYPMTADLLVN